MIDKKKFKAALAGALTEAGFLGKGQSWYLNGTDVLVVVNLQKSDFDDKYYLNFGASLRRLGIGEFPKENQCHIQVRLTSLFPDHSEVFERGCHLGESAEGDLKEMVDFIRVECNPFFQQCIKEIELKNLIVSGRFKKALIMKVLKEEFNLPVD